MLAKVNSFGINGIDAYPVTIEVDVARGLPSMHIVGLPDSAIKESRERVRSAIKNSGFDFPCGRITVNLAPADMKKEGPAFDLAIACGILVSSDKIPLNALAEFAFMGELSLSGNILPIAGALQSAIACRNQKLKGIIVPSSNASESVLANSVDVFPFDRLDALIAFLNQPDQRAPFQQPTSVDADLLPDSADFQDIKGQTHAKRGLEVAAAGGHNALLIGPPGSGKTMLARRVSTILPPMSQEEALEVTKIHSVSNRLGNRNTTGLIIARPLRSPHHTASHIALIGGGSDPKPGEVTLAHNGILFLDELPEFSRTTLESLRQPMEDHFVTVARAARTLRFPSRFMLIAAMNPCPCGYLMDTRRQCRCAAAEVSRYMGRISGPLLERIDLHLQVPALSSRELTGVPTGESSSTIKTRTMNARAQQKERFRQEKIFANSQMSSTQIRRFCPLNTEGQRLLHEAIDTLGLSARVHDKLLKLSRTIADLASSDHIKPEHLAEAIGYRYLDKMNA